MSKPTVMQHLGAIRICFDWHVIGGILPVNPAYAVHGPSTPSSAAHAGARRQTGARASGEASIPQRSSGCAITALTYAFARVDDFGPFANDKRWWARLHKKGRQASRDAGAHKLETFLDEQQVGSLSSPASCGSVCWIPSAWGASQCKFSW